jgi:hypothetical protein
MPSVRAARQAGRGLPADGMPRGPLATGMPAMGIATATTDMIGLDNIAITDDSAYWVSFVESVGHEIVARATLPN